MALPMMVDLLSKRKHSACERIRQPHPELRWAHLSGSTTKMASADWATKPVVADGETERLIGCFGPGEKAGTQMRGGPLSALPPHCPGDGLLSELTASVQPRPRELLVMHPIRYSLYADGVEIRPGNSGDQRGASTSSLHRHGDFRWATLASQPQPLCVLFLQHCQKIGRSLGSKGLIQLKGG